MWRPGLTTSLVNTDECCMVFCSEKCRAEYKAATPEFNWHELITARTHSTNRFGTDDNFGPRCAKCGSDLE